MFYCKYIYSFSKANTASIGRRYSFDSLKNIILDIWLLSETDYLVCTFSSQVCRLAFELMQSKQVNISIDFINFNLFSIQPIDKSMNFYSLDDIYYFGGQSSHNQIAILNNKPKIDNEIDLKIGDILGK